MQDDDVLRFDSTYPFILEDRKSLKGHTDQRTDDSDMEIEMQLALIYLKKKQT